MIYIHKYKVGQVEARLGALYKKAPQVIARALNRAAENARTNIVRKTTENYHVKASDVRGTIRIEKATKDRLRVIVRARDTRRELIAFRVRPGKPSPKRLPKFIRVAVRKDGLKPLPGAFIARGTSSGKLHVLKRTTSKRYPIQIKYGPSIPEMIGQEKIRVYVEREAEVIFEKRLEHEINRLLEGNL